ncbi:MAG: Uma2 family endonuclease [Chloroflexota bacterium]
MVIAAQTSPCDYEALAARDLEGQWELWDGSPRAKPGMTFAHNDLGQELGHMLRNQLDRRQYRVRSNTARVRWSDRNVFIPDVVVVPASDAVALRDQTQALETYVGSMPLVVEVWSRSTGDYDQEVKILTYKARGDAEIWRIHPYQRILQRWVHEPDGAYRETIHTPGTVTLAALPGVAIDLDALFASLDDWAPAAE